MDAERRTQQMLAGVAAATVVAVGLGVVAHEVQKRRRERSPSPRDQRRSGSSDVVAMLGMALIGVLLAGVAVLTRSTAQAATPPSVQIDPAVPAERSDGDEYESAINSFDPRPGSPSTQINWHSARTSVKSTPLDATEQRQVSTQTALVTNNQPNNVTKKIQLETTKQTLIELERIKEEVKNFITDNPNIDSEKMKTFLAASPEMLRAVQRALEGDSLSNRFFFRTNVTGVVRNILSDYKTVLKRIKNNKTNGNKPNTEQANQVKAIVQALQNMQPKIQALYEDRQFQNDITTMQEESSQKGDPALPSARTTGQSPTRSTQNTPDETEPPIVDPVRREGSDHWQSARTNPLDATERTQTALVAKHQANNIKNNKTNGKNGITEMREGREASEHEAVSGRPPGSGLGSGSGSGLGSGSGSQKGDSALPSARTTGQSPTRSTQNTAVEAGTQRIKKNARLAWNPERPSDAKRQSLPVVKQIPLEPLFEQVQTANPSKKFHVNELNVNTTPRNGSNAIASETSSARSNASENDSLSIPNTTVTAHSEDEQSNEVSSTTPDGGSTQTPDVEKIRTKPSIFTNHFFLAQLSTGKTP
jgi:hypothetical protein